MTFKVRFGTYVFFDVCDSKIMFFKTTVIRAGYFCPLFLTSNHRYNIGLKFPKFQPSRATITISNSNSFDLFSYGLESVFWYFQFQMLIVISYFSDNPLKLHKISCRDPQICSIRDICLPFSKKMEISPFWCELDVIF